MAQRGGPRAGSGRKSKAEEQELQKKLDPMEADFLDALHKGIIAGNPIVLKMYAEYRFGKPQDHITIDGDLEVKTVITGMKIL